MLFKTIRVSETAEGKFDRTIGQMNIEELPPGELLVRVHYSSLNYKDALSASGNKGVTRNYPHTPGIDAAGVIALSRNENFAADEEIIVTGFDLGMNTHGGFSEYIRIPAAWALPKPDAYTLSECMTIGTAGLTAALALYKMELLGQTPAMGPVVVTGATGGVGSLAVAILAKAGYKVIAVTGKENAGEYLEHLGAAHIESRDFVNDLSNKSLIRSQWAGAIDTVGGNTLNTLLKGCIAEGCVVSTGLVGSPLLNTTVYPFIINGVSLAGVGSAETPIALKKKVWEKLADDWNIRNKLAAIAKEVSLEELNNHYIDAILQGKIMGRIVVKI